jgi:hypothetical protein
MPGFDQSLSEPSKLPGPVHSAQGRSDAYVGRADDVFVSLRDRDSFPAAQPRDLNAGKARHRGTD